MRRPLAAGAVVAAALIVAAPAWAHVELDPASAKANLPTPVEIVVEHGCGTSPISKVATQLPPEAVDVVPEAPDGWTVSIAGKVVTWDGSARPVAEDLHLGLTFTARAEVGTELGFPTIESCPNGESVRWIEDVPEGGDETQHPQPRLAVTEGAPAPTTVATTAAPASTAGTTASTATSATSAPTTAAAPGAAAPTTAIASPDISTTGLASDDGDDDSSSTGVIVAVIVGVLLLAGTTVAIARRRAARSAS